MWFFFSNKQNMYMTLICRICAHDEITSRPLIMFQTFNWNRLQYDLPRIYTYRCTTIIMSSGIRKPARIMHRFRCCCYLQVWLNKPHFSNTECSNTHIIIYCRVLSFTYFKSEHIKICLRFKPELAEAYGQKLWLKLTDLLETIIKRHLQNHNSLRFLTSGVLRILGR